MFYDDQIENMAVLEKGVSCDFYENSEAKLD